MAAKSRLQAWNPVPHPTSRTRWPTRTPAKPTSRKAVVDVTNSKGLKDAHACRWPALNCSSASIPAPLGAEDAQYLAREFYPVFSEDDFLNLPTHHIYLRMTIDGVASRPFDAKTLRPG
jgi:hypothetical protein